MTEFHWSGASPVGPGHSVWERIPDTSIKPINTSIELINTSIELINTCIETHTALAFSFMHAL